MTRAEATARWAAVPVAALVAGLVAAALTGCGARVTLPPPPQIVVGSQTITVATPPASIPQAAPAPQAATETVLSVSGLAADGIPTVALNAYRVAAAILDNADPQCDIQWSLVAAIGRVESDHGRFGGAVLTTSGTSVPKIIGPALNGQNGFPYIASTDGGLLDGDRVYAHAVGPMQFLPATWYEYAVAGHPDPFNINDAALATARYLCAASGDLRTIQAQTNAVYAYNHSLAYVQEVLALSAYYAQGVNLAGIPVVGTTRGTVRAAAAPTRAANPAPPPAVRTSTTPSGTTSSPSPTGSTSGSNPLGSLLCNLGGHPAGCPR